MAVKTYRKTALVTAEQFLPAIGRIPRGVFSNGLGDPRKRYDCEWVLNTKEGQHYVRDGDYICTGPAGEQWNVAREIFEATYEEADAAPVADRGPVSMPDVDAEKLVTRFEKAHFSRCLVETGKNIRAYEEARAALIAALSAAPQPNPSKVDESAVIEAARFIADRLEDFRQKIDDIDDEREFEGHVIPALARLRASLSAQGEKK